jgi:DnaJ-class molecular chaperone
MSHNPRAPWSPEKKRRFAEMVAAGMSDEQIGNAFGVSAATIKWRRYYMGCERPPKKTTTRRCLRCQKSFASHGPHNRLCPRCHFDIQNISPLAIP